MKTSHHAKNIKEVMAKLKTREKGLSSSEVKARWQTYGRNQLPREKRAGWLVILFQQFVSPLIIVLILAAVISAVLREWVDASVILAAVLLNGTVGFVQEYKAGKSLDALRSLVEPHALVRRNGKQKEVKASEIVPGDILILRAGDRVPADARVFEEVELLIDESPLTGESAPIKKQIALVSESASLADRVNMVFAGTSIVAGRGMAIVVATGTKTEIGRVAELVRTTKEQKTPLQAELSQLARWITAIVVLLVVVLFFIGIATGNEVVEMFEISVSLAVAAIPEGLAVSITVILAIGMQRILRRKSLVRRLVAAETLGSVSVICTDKTGTITEGKMKVVEIIGANGKDASVALRKQILEAVAICNDAFLNESTGKVEGSPTEKALLQASVDEKIAISTLLSAHKREAEIPFDSSRKFMVTRNRWGSSRVLLMKGAPERVMAFASQNGALTKIAEKMTDEGLRVIAVAVKKNAGTGKKISESEFKGLKVIGFIGLRDPLRKNVAKEIQKAKDAGVRTVMITGDHPNTARAIARQAGLIVSEVSLAIGSDLDKWTDAELARKLSHITVYARVEPRHKIRIVRAWQEKGEVVAMTGDGVNDAPAIKAADIGIAVGTGTEVAKQASDLVLLDNNLGTITKAIEQGRVIFDNIRKTVVYLMADSFTEIVLIGGSLMFGLPLPLLPAQILWINLVADSFPTIGLTLEPGEPDIMKQKPRGRHEPVMNHEMLSLIFIIGIVTDLALFGLYAWLLQKTNGDMETARSVMFAAVGIDSLLYVFAIKSFRRTIFRINPFSNLWLVLGVAIGFGLMLLVLLFPPLQRAFEVVPLHLNDWILLLTMGVLKLVAIELTKEWFIVRKTVKK